MVEEIGHIVVVGVVGVVIGEDEEVILEAGVDLMKITNVEIHNNIINATIKDKINLTIINFLKEILLKICYNNNNLCKRIHNFKINNNFYNNNNKG